MIGPAFFIETLRANSIEFYSGIPDSLLKGLCAYITDNFDANSHIIAANEGAAVGLAAGYHLATGKIPAAYMQNSGIGNAVNPLLSLIDKEVYGIPLLLLIGWRGEPDTKDEPQHVKQGKVTIPLLNAAGINHSVLSGNEAVADAQIAEAVKYLQRGNIFAFVIRKGIFEDYSLQKQNLEASDLSREEAIQTVALAIERNAIVVSSTGMISRELFEYRERTGQMHKTDFLTVGAMGHASQIALGVALHQKAKKVYCFDGDGAMLMHLGGLATIGSLQPANFVHIVFNNGAHDSVGGQPTAALNIDAPAIAKATGYKTCFSVDNKIDILRILAEAKEHELPLFLEVKVKRGNRSDLGRPTTTPIQNKEIFMNYLQS
jgi:phosphonopyruvate decarboxylase